MNRKTPNLPIEVFGVFEILSFTRGETRYRSNKLLYRQEINLIRMNRQQIVLGKQT